MNLTRIFLLACCLLFINTGTFAQATKTISGTVKAKKSGEEITGCIVMLKDIPSAGTATNSYGFYSLSAPAGSYTLVVSYIGYITVELPITLTEDLTRNVNMEEEGRTLNEVVVTDRRTDENVTRNEMGSLKLDIKTINKLPVILGERDIIKAIQLTPGVKTGGDGNSGFYVRGGAADQNLILLDEAPVYNASHLLGFFSTFNSDAIKDVTLYKGSMPAQYGGRLASVLDVRMNEGNNQDYHASGGIGLIASRLALEGPIQKGKSSFLLSGRRTYADVFLNLSSDEGVKNSSLYFYDLNAKLNYQLDEKNKLYLSGYFGRDNLGLKNLFGFGWGNTTGTLRWNHIASSRIFSNTSLIFSDYRYKVSVTSGTTEFAIRSNIQDINLKQEFSYYASNKHTIKYGLNTIYHTIVPGNIEASATASLNTTTAETRYAWENAIYLSDDWKINDKLSLNAGLRMSAFSLLGKGTFNDYDADGNVTNSETYTNGQFVQTYFVPEPRLSASYLLNDVSSVKAAFVRNAQYLHLLRQQQRRQPHRPLDTKQPADETGDRRAI